MTRLTAAETLEKMGKLRALLEDLAQAPRKVAVIAAPKISRLLRRQFTAGTDPYGRPWAPLRPSTLAKGRRPPPLTDTRKLRDGTKATVAPGGRAGIRLVVGARYGQFHQTGFRVGKTRVKPRRILPQQGMPREWRSILDDAARKVALDAARRHR